MSYFLGKKLLLSGFSRALTPDKAQKGEKTPYQALAAEPA
jgi:hypothetical protein